MNFFTVGKFTINLDQILYIEVETRDDEGNPKEGSVFFPTAGKSGDRITSIDLEGDDLNQLLEAADFRSNRA